MTEDQVKGQNLNKDEGEDVEGHAHKNVNLEPSEGQQLGRDDDGDDVEGHMHKANVNYGSHKA